MTVRMGLRDIVGGVLLSLAVAVLPPSWALASSSLELDPARVAWSRLLLRASDARGEVSIEIRLSPVPAAELAPVLATGSGRAIKPPADAQVWLMTAIIEVRDYQKNYRTDVWFVPRDASALQRRRDKVGKGANRKTFRYLLHGVQRVRLEPDGEQEADLPPEQWPVVKEHFYPYGPAKAGCSVLSDPALLLFIASADVLTDEGERLDVCVFNKQTLYRARLSAGALRSLKVDYAEIGPDFRNDINRDITARKIRLEARPSGAGELKPDPFEFFEMPGDIDILLDEFSRIPVEVVGNVSGLGRVVFTLSEVTLSR
jgi:hypothetical protein